MDDFSQKHKSTSITTAKVCNSMGITHSMHGFDGELCRRPRVLGPSRGGHLLLVPRGGPLDGFYAWKLFFLEPSPLPSQFPFPHQRALELCPMECRCRQMWTVWTWDCHWLEVYWLRASFSFVPWWSKGHSELIWHILVSGAFENLLQWAWDCTGDHHWICSENGNLVAAESETFWWDEMCGDWFRFRSDSNSTTVSARMGWTHEQDQLKAHNFSCSFICYCNRHCLRIESGISPHGGSLGPSFVLRIPETAMLMSSVARLSWGHCSLHFDLHGWVEVWFVEAEKGLQEAWLKLQLSSLGHTIRRRPPSLRKYTVLSWISWRICKWTLAHSRLWEGLFLWVTAWQPRVQSQPMKPC